MGMLSDNRMCEACYGDGLSMRLTADGASLPCPHCYGTGRQLTDLGREMLRLLDEHFGLVPKKR